MRRLVIALLALVIGLPALATEPNPSARQRELVLELMKTTNMTRLGRDMLDAVYGELDRQMSAGEEHEGSELAEIFKIFREKATKLDLASEMQESFVRIYAKYFTESELQDLITFYNTPTGKKSLEIAGNLMREGMEAANRDLTPKIETLMAESREEYHKARPWVRTISDMENVSSSLVVYSLDNEEKYPAGDYASLKASLELDTLPEKDGWGHAYVYIVSPDQKHFRLVSAGGDAVVNWDSKRLAVKDDAEIETRYSEHLEEDLILTDGEWEQMPVQAKPKMPAPQQQQQN